MEFPKSPERNISGGTCRLKLAFSASMKRHRVSYSNFTPQVDTKSEDLELDKDSDPPEDSPADPIPKIIHTDPSLDVEDKHNVSDEAIVASTPDVATKVSKRMAKPKFMTSRKGKKEDKDKDKDKEKKTKVAERNDSTSSSKKVKSESDPLPDIATFDDLSKVAVQAPNLDFVKSKPRGPARRPPCRKSNIPTDALPADSDLFTELSAASVPGFESIPDVVDAPVRDDRPDNLDLTEQTDPPENAETLSEKRAPPPTSPRKPHKVSLGMGPDLASVLQAGLVKAKVRSSKSHENIYEDLANEGDPEKSTSRTVRKVDSQPVTSVKPKPRQRPESKLIKLPENNKPSDLAKPAEIKSEEIPVAEKPKLAVITDSSQDETPDAKLETTPMSPGPVLSESEMTPKKDKTSISLEPEKATAPAEERTEEISKEAEISKETGTNQTETESESVENKVVTEPDVTAATQVDESDNKDSDKEVPGTADNTAELDVEPEKSPVAEKPEDSVSAEPITEVTTKAKDIPKSPDLLENKIEGEAKVRDTALEPILSSPNTAVRRSTLPAKSLKKTEFGDVKSVATSMIAEEGDVRKSPIVSRKPIVSKDKLQGETKKKEDVSGDSKKPQVTNRPRPAVKPSPTKGKPKLTSQSPERIGEKEDTQSQAEKQESAAPEPNSADEVSSHAGSFESVSSTEGPASPLVKVKPTTPVKPKRVSTGATDENKAVAEAASKEHSSVLNESVTKETEQSDSSQDATPGDTGET